MICGVDGCGRLARAYTINGKLHIFCEQCHMAFMAGMAAGFRMGAGLDNKGGSE